MPREDGFDITVASEIMAVLCLAPVISDLKDRLARMVVAYTYDGQPVTADDLKAEGAMAALLKDAAQAQSGADAGGHPRASSTAAPSPTSPTAATPLPPPAWL